MGGGLVRTALGGLVSRPLCGRRPLSPGSRRHQNHAPRASEGPARPVGPCTPAPCSPCEAISGQVLLTSISPGGHDRPPGWPGLGKKGDESGLVSGPLRGEELRAGVRGCRQSEETSGLWGRLGIIPSQIVARLSQTHSAGDLVAPQRRESPPGVPELNVWGALDGRAGGVMPWGHNTPRPGFQAVCLPGKWLSVLRDRRGGMAQDPQSARTTHFSQTTDIRSSMPLVPSGMSVKLSLPTAFWAVVKVQWALPVTWRSPLRKGGVRGAHRGLIFLSRPRPASFAPLPGQHSPRGPEAVPEQRWARPVARHGDGGPGRIGVGSLPGGGVPARGSCRSPGLLGAEVVAGRPEGLLTWTAGR